MTTGLVLFAATYPLIAVQRPPFVHLSRPPASLLGVLASLPVRSTPDLLGLAMEASVGGSSCRC